MNDEMLLLAHPTFIFAFTIYNIKPTIQPTMIPAKSLLFLALSAAVGAQDDGLPDCTDYWHRGECVLAESDSTGASRDWGKYDLPDLFASACHHGGCGAVHASLPW